MQLKNYMAEPITPISQLEKNQDDMKTQMELLIMRIQAEFCKALEKEEDEVCYGYFYLFWYFFCQRPCNPNKCCHCQNFSMNFLLLF